MIASSSDSVLSMQVAERLAGPSGLFKTALNGTDSMVTFTESKEAGWQYVSVMPMDSVMERVAQLKRMALTVFVVSLVARERLFRQTPVIRADFLSRLIRGVHRSRSWGIKEGCPLRPWASASRPRSLP
ncbi:hypothetical protein MKY82_15735 [Paenibacillus sp. FSL W7-1279]|uniref:hypothetical protein n=1 Tax=Paenibacillus sp. FSL W7-1279 TaxID=2921697 RepID=UPI0030D8607B